MRYFSGICNLIAVAVALGGGNPVLAVDSDDVTSTTTGTTTYRIVYPDKASADYPAGVYARQRDGRFRLTVPGSVQVSESLRTPILAQLKLTEIDQKEQSLVLVDGALKWMSLDSAPDQPNSVLSFGDDSLALLDPIADFSVSLPPIQSAEDIVIFEQNSHRPGRSVLFISVRFGDTGLTMAVEVGAMQQSQIQPASPVYLVDRRFHNKTALMEMGRLTYEMSKAAGNETSWVPSPLAQKWMWQKVREKAFANYSQHLDPKSASRAWGSGLSLSAATLEGVVAMSLSDGGFRSRTRPHFRIHSRNKGPHREFALWQVFDPIAGKNQIVATRSRSQVVDHQTTLRNFFGFESQNELLPIVRRYSADQMGSQLVQADDVEFTPIPGVVDLATSGEPLYQHVLFSGDSYELKFEFISVQHRQMIIIHPAATYDQSFVLSNEQLDDFSVYLVGHTVLVGGIPNAKERFLFIYSEKLHNGLEQTRLLEVDIDTSNRVINHRFSDLDQMSDRFIEAGDLASRIDSKNIGGREYKLLSDAEAGEDALPVNLTLSAALNETVFGLPLKVDEGRGLRWSWLNIQGELWLADMSKTIPQLIFNSMGSFKNIHTWVAPAPIERDKGIQIRLVVVNFEDDNGDLETSFYAIVQNDNGGLSLLESLTPPSLVGRRFISGDLYQRMRRIEAVAKDEHDDYLFDLSENRDGTQLVRVFESIRQRELVEDLSSSAQRSAKLARQNMVKELEQEFPGLAFELDTQGVVLRILSEAQELASVPVQYGPKLVEGESAFRVHSAQVGEFPAKFAVFTAVERKSNMGSVQRETLIHVLMAVNMNGAWHHRWVSGALSPKFVSHAQDWNFVFEQELAKTLQIEWLPAPTDAAANAYALLWYRRPPPTSIRDRNSDDGDARDISTLLLEIGDVLSGNPKLELGLFGRLRNHQDALGLMARFDDRYLMTTVKHPDHHAKSLTLYGVIDDMKVTPNTAAGRQYAAKIKFLAEPLRYLEERNRDRTFFVGSWGLSPDDVSLLPSLLRDDKAIAINDTTRRLLQPTLQLIEDRMQHQIDGQFPMTVFLVPERLKSTLMAFLGKAFVDEDRRGRFFHRSNENLSLYMPLIKARKSADGKNRSEVRTVPTQYQVVDNLEVMAAGDRRNNLLVADIADLITFDIPTNDREKSSYYTELQTSEEDAEDEDEQEAKVEQRSLLPAATKESDIFPHLSFIFAAGVDSTMTFEATRQMPKLAPNPRIFIGTHAEWDAFMRNSKNEFYRYGGESWFETIEVAEPSMKQRTQLLVSLFDQPKIKALRYKFSTKGIRRDELEEDNQRRSELMEYTVKRVETLTHQSEENSLVLFLDFVNEFNRALIQDETVRRKQLIDRDFIERVITSKFNVPLNSRILPETDYLRIAERDNAPVLLQAAGYERAPIATIKRIIDMVRAPLFPDAGRAIPGFTLLVGQHGSGKTHLYESLMKMFKLKEYDFSQGAEYNSTAWAMHLKADKLLDDEGKSNDRKGMTVNDAKIHLDYLLSRPQGHRAIIFIDDLHAARESVRTELLTWLRSLVDSKGGVHVISEGERKLSNGDVITIKDKVRKPVRGLLPIIAINLTQEESAIKRFVGNGPRTLEKHILATLSTKDLTIEESFLNRLRILPIGEFPVEAKPAVLASKLSERNSDLLEQNGQLIFVSLDGIREFVGAFADLNARQFLSDAINEIYSLVTSLNRQSGMVILTPAVDGDDDSFANLPIENEKDSARRERTTVAAENVGGAIFSSGTNNRQMIQHIRERFQVLNVSANHRDFEGRLQFLELMLNSFRMGIFEALARAIQDHPSLNQSGPVDQLLLQPLVQALYDHLEINELMPVTALNLDAQQFVGSNVQLREYYARHLAQLRKATGRRSYFPFAFSDRSRRGLAYRELTQIHMASPVQRNRKSVLVETSEVVNQLLVPALRAFFRVEDHESLPDVRAWAQKLPVRDPSLVPLGDQLLQQMNSFWHDMGASSLRERTSSQYKHPNSYQMARMFLFVVDKAIADFSWDQLSGWFLDLIAEMNENGVLNQDSNYQNLIAKSNFSPLRLRTRDYALTIVTSLPGFGLNDMNQARLNSNQNAFMEACQNALE